MNNNFNFTWYFAAMLSTSKFTQKTCTALKMKFSIKDFFSKCGKLRNWKLEILQGTANLVTFTEEILHGKLHFLCSDAIISWVIVFLREAFWHLQSYRHFDNYAGTWIVIAFKRTCNRTQSQICAILILFPSKSLKWNGVAMSPVHSKATVVICGMIAL